MSALIAAVGITCTLVINPWTAWDPINLPKFAVLVSGASVLLIPVFYRRYSISHTLPVMAKVSLALFLIGSLVPLFLADQNVFAQLFGTWGRNTGFLTYISLMITLLASFLVGLGASLHRFLKAFTLTSYVISGYTWLQYGDLDPISWSQKAPVATLGNINFMSSFVGLANILFFSRVIHDKLNWSSRTFFLSLILTNTLLIENSGSIQGIAIMAVGFTLSLSVLIFKRFGSIRSFFYLLSSSALGVLVFFGSAGIGPLARFRQETVLYRLDYWKAGMNMFISNPISGVGWDSYGDFYRLYRDSEALARTGPQRVTNTAHNVFIDLFASSGVLVGVSFIVLVTFTLTLSLYYVTKIEVKGDDKHLPFLLSGWLVFLLISINQIGVTIWGFIFLGSALSFVVKSQSQSDKQRDVQKESDLRSHVTPKARAIRREAQKSTIDSRESDQFNAPTIVIGSAILMGLLLSLPSNVADSMFLREIKMGNLETARLIWKYPGATVQHGELLIQRFNEANRTTDSLTLARDIVSVNSRNWQAWVEIALNPNASLDERRQAARTLTVLDPLNEAVRNDLATLLESEK